MQKLPFSILSKRDIAGILAMQVMLFYTMTQMDYGLNLSNYESGVVVIFKVLTSLVSLLFASVSFAVLYLAPHLLVKNRLLKAVF